MRSVAVEERREAYSLIWTAGWTWRAGMLNKNGADSVDRLRCVFGSSFLAMLLNQYTRSSRKSFRIDDSSMWLYLHVIPQRFPWFFDHTLLMCPYCYIFFPHHVYTCNTSLTAICTSHNVVACHYSPTHKNPFQPSKFFFLSYGRGWLHQFAKRFWYVSPIYINIYWNFLNK